MKSVEWTLSVVCVLACTVPLFGAIDPTDRPVVNTTKGEVKGWYVESKATEGKYMKAFKGIPFAEPPVNKLRFLDPVEVRKWNGTKDLPITDPTPCPQMMSSLTYGSINEDCLIVNVYTPQDANSRSKLPVMVWIYGGSFTIGTSSSLLYGGDFLVDQDVVFVSMNYRVGALGFLNLGTDEVPGNAGLKDQLLALQWVQNEISNFGNDPTAVTLFGESAGAASVIMHYLSPKTENLFRYAIAESGNAIASWPFLESGFIEIATDFSLRLNCSVVDNTFNLGCLQNAAVGDILQYQNLQIFTNRTLAGIGSSFVPSLEKSSAAAFLNDTPINLLKSLASSGSTKRPIITGINKDDGSLRVVEDPNFYTQFYKMLQYFIPVEIRINKTESEIEYDVADIKSKYFNNTEPSLSNLAGYINIHTDQLFGLSTANFARELANTTKVYLYHFLFNGVYKRTNTSLATLNLTDVVGHGDELGYIFSRYFLNQSSAFDGTPSMKTLRRMVKLWTNFAKYGNPTPDNTIDGFIWSPITVGSYHYAKIEDQISMSADNFKEDALQFWNNIYSRHTSLSTRISCSFVLLSFAFLLRIFL